MMSVSRPTRPGFKPRSTEEYVVLKPVRVKGEWQEVGTVIPKSSFPVHVLRFHYNQRRVGPAGDRWTEFQLYLYAMRVWRANGEQGDRPETPEWLEDVYAKQKSVMAAVQAPAPDAPDLPVGNPDLDQLTEIQQAPKVEHVGGGYYEVTRGADVVRVKGKDAVKELGVEVD